MADAPEGIFVPGQPDPKISPELYCTLTLLDEITESIDHVPPMILDGLALTIEYSYTAML